MQINGFSSGPTMAASEPPEPPPRNPERINASLHKLNEAVSKSLEQNKHSPKPYNSANSRLHPSI